MNNKIKSLIIQGKLIEKRDINKYIIKKNLEKVILNFNEYSSKTKNKDFLLKNIISYTKLVNVNSIYLDKLYIHVIKPLIKNNTLDFNLLPNIIHTYKKNYKYNYVLKEISNYVLDVVEKKVQHSSVGTISTSIGNSNNGTSCDRRTELDLPNWLSILQVFASKKYNNFINITLLFKYIFVIDHFNINGSNDSNRKSFSSMDCRNNNTTVNSSGNTTVNSNDNTTINSNENTTINSNENTTINSNDNTTINSNDNTTINSNDNTTINSNENTTINSNDNTGGNRTVRGNIYQHSELSNLSYFKYNTYNYYTQQKQYNKSSYIKCPLVLLNNINYKTIQLLAPRSFSIFISLLSKIRIINTKKNNCFYNFIQQKMTELLPKFNNIDLCLIIESLQLFKHSNKYLFKQIEFVIMNRITTFDTLQLVIIFYHLAKYGNYNINKQLIILFMKKIKKYIFLYLLHKKEPKYILFTKDKKTMPQIISMFFLTYVKHIQPYISLPYYYNFTKFLMEQLMLLSTYVLNLKKKDILLLPEYTNKNEYYEEYIINNSCYINQYISNLIFSFIGYFYNMLTIPYDKTITNTMLSLKKKKKYIFLTLNNINQIVTYFFFFYNNKTSITKYKNFITPLHKSQWLTFLYTYWSIILDLYHFLYNNSYNQTINNILNFYTKKKDKNKDTLADFYFFIKLKHIKQLFSLINILEEINDHTMMNQMLCRNHIYLNNIYLNILNIINHSNYYEKNEKKFVFHRRIVGPYTVSVLCSSDSVT
ncbi:conserved membrane protein, unknown function [Hepatocystis sp. ex Piliocolobus tephrosceles]|nr:conserved membrane protein, unknown function [Hepatocystis sp. ex Piliocolobus tephrosceles]